MKRPIKPRKPAKPSLNCGKPSKTYEQREFVDRVPSGGYTIEEFIRVLKQNNVQIIEIDNTSYDVIEYYKIKTYQNHYYDDDLRGYEQEQEKLKPKLAKYEEKMKQYELDLKVWEEKMVEYNTFMEVEAKKAKLAEFCKLKEELNL